MQRSLLIPRCTLTFALLLPTPLAGQGRIEIDILHSRALAGNRLGDSPDREVYVYLYAMSPCCLGFVGELAPGSDAWRQPGRWDRMINPLAAAFAPGERLATRLVGDQTQLQNVTAPGRRLRLGAEVRF